MRAAIVVACLLAAGVNGAHLRSNHVDDHVKLAKHIESTQLSTDAMEMALDAALEEGQSLGQLAAQAAKTIDLDTAMKGIELPTEVSQLVAHKGKSSSGLGLDPAAVDKAVNKLNDMINKAQMKLDEKFVECWEFRERNRGSFKQVMTDLSRIGGTISDLERMMLNAVSSISEIDQNTQHTEEDMAREKKIFDNQWAIDSQDLRIKQNDLEVAEFMLGVTKCKKTSLIQAGQKVEAGMMVTEVKTCNGQVSFSDSRLQNSTRQLSAQGLKLLESALNRAPLDDGGIDAADAIAESAGAIINDDYDDGDDTPPRGDASSFVQSDPKSSNPFAEMKMAPLTAAPKTVPPAKGPPKNKVQNKCANAKPDCAVLHDVFASLWGEMKDLVEAKQEKMDKDMAAWMKAKSNFNAQLSMLALQMGQEQAILAESTTMKATETDEQTQKVLEKEALEKEFKKVMHICKMRKRYIFWTEICGVIKVRTEVLKEGSDEQKEASATDCAVSKWVPGECSSPCDPKMKGGMQTITREVITINEKYGQYCPSLTWNKKCNEFKCPIDCDLDAWSGWSKCTKECGGGVQSRTRSLVVKPKDGGRSCDTLQESRPCNAFSCDRDCLLRRWTKRTPCSKACGRGMQERFRHIRRPVRAEGFCYNKMSKARYRKRKCNTQRCVGDEVCIANLDLIIAIDGSGSISEKGFDILKTFAKSLMSRLKTVSYGHEAVKVAVIQFGNGELDDKTKVVSDALVISGLSDKLDEVKGKIDGMVWNKGFTNMAQGFMKASQLVTRSPRKQAAGTMLMITDGKPSFKFQTDKAVKALKGRARVVIVQVKAFAMKDTVTLMKKYVSKPWPTNYVFINGKNKLKAAYGKYADKVLVSACPRAESPRANYAKAMEDGFELLFERGNCGQDEDVKVIEAFDAHHCYSESAAYDGIKAFAFNHVGSGDCLLYTKECKIDKLLPNTTYDVYKPVSSGSK